MICSNCNTELRSSDALFAFDESYCESCHSDLFTYCTDCDSLIYRNEASFYESDPYCSDCYEKSFDDDSPDNPNVYEEDRSLIVTLSRNWLYGKTDNRRYLFINQGDDFLSSIKANVGRVDLPLYLFGLIDRDTYQLSASPDIYQHLLPILERLNLPYTVKESSGNNRLGISHSLRKYHKPEIIKLIKELTTIKQEQYQCAE